MSKVSSEPLFTIQEEDVHSWKSISEIHINTSITPNISSLPKELIPDNIFSVEEKLLSQPVTYSQSAESQKVLPSATSNLPLETKELTPDVQELMPQLSATLMMDQKLESDFHQEPEKPFQVSAEPPSVSLPVEEETKSQSWRLVHFSTSSRDSERDSHKLLVLEWIQSTIPTEVVTTSIWVNQEPLTDLPQLVKKLVLSLLEELVSLEVLKPLRTSPKRFDWIKYLNFDFIFINFIIFFSKWRTIFYEKEKSYFWKIVF